MMAGRGYEVPIAALFAALLETLDQLDPSAQERFDKNMKEMTPLRLAKVLQVLKEYRYKSDTPQQIEQECLREAKAFLGS